MRRRQWDFRESKELWDQEIDNRIRDALDCQAEPLNYGKNEDLGREEALRNRVFAQIKEETTMKHTGWKFKKIAVAAGAMCILGSAVVMAAGQFKGIITHSTVQEEFSSYEEL